MTTTDRLVATGCLAVGAVNLVLLLQSKERTEYAIKGIVTIFKILIGTPV